MFNFAEEFNKIKVYPFDSKKELALLSYQSLLSTIDKVNLMYFAAHNNRIEFLDNILKDKQMAALFDPFMLPAEGDTIFTIEHILKTGKYDPSVNNNSALRQAIHSKNHKYVSMLLSDKRVKPFEDRSIFIDVLNDNDENIILSFIERDDFDYVNYADILTDFKKYSRCVLHSIVNNNTFKKFYTHNWKLNERDIQDKYPIIADLFRYTGYKHWEIFGDKSLELILDDIRRDNYGRVDFNKNHEAFIKFGVLNVKFDDDDDKIIVNYDLEFLKNAGNYVIPNNEELFKRIILTGNKYTSDRTSDIEIKNYMKREGIENICMKSDNSFKVDYKYPFVKKSKLSDLIEKQKLGVPLDDMSAIEERKMFHIKRCKLSCPTTIRVYYKYKDCEDLLETYSLSYTLDHLVRCGLHNMSFSKIDRSTETFSYFKTLKYLNIESIEITSRVVEVVYDKTITKNSKLPV